MTIDINFEDPRWQDLGIQALADQAADTSLTYLGLQPQDWEISVLACDDGRIQGLNADFRDKPKPTNVLSWPSEERAALDPGARPELPKGPDTELGDIAIAYETCAREATELGKSMQDHVTHLLVHGVLHLLGYDHIRDQDATLMQDIETQILGKMGLADPYRDITG
ncbi:rRNA maturation RNase YbeY [Cognatishimia sp. WU-CL00825]|uniref:rRNA maturation RNase YbeY n=1 Tax=Cognatishimia sp. WU-CL00825 TaxID=3127658 RepID=UPI0031095E15